MKKSLALALASAGLMAALPMTASAAAVVTDATVLATTTITPGSAFSPLAEAVGNQTVGTGIDFSYGNVEGIFNDGGGVYGFCGISGGGICTLTEAVDGAIVGLASSIYAEAGFSNPGELTLAVFDSSQNLLQSVINGAPLGVYGRTTFSITRASADIAYFSIFTTTNDAFGVNQISLDGLTSANTPVPEPATWAMMLVGFGLIGGAMRARRRRPQVRFAF